MKKQSKNKKSKRLIKNSKNKKLSFLLLSLICLIILTNVIYTHYSRNTELKEVPEYTIGTINKKYNIRSRGYYINYNFRVKDENYRGSTKLNKSELEKVKVGDKYEVTYSRINPEYNKISFDKRIEKHIPEIEDKKEK